MFAGRYNKGISHLSKGFAGLTIILTLLMGSRTFAQEPYQRLVRRFEMPELGIPNPAGLAFSPLANALLVAPSPGTSELILVTFAPDVADSATVATPVIDPVNMAFDGKYNSLLFFDAGVDELIEIKAGANGQPEPFPESVTRFDAQPFGATQAQGMTFDPETGDLFFLVVPAASVPRIVRVTPDPEVRFDGPAAEQDGRILEIALNSLSSSPLRGIAFNPGDGHLFVVNPVERILYELSQEGELLSTRDLSGFEDLGASELTDIQNIAFAPSGDQTDDPGIMNLYMADSGLKSEQGLGDIFELSLTRPDQLELRSLGIEDAAVLEGDSGQVNMVFTVTLSGVSQQTVTVDYVTQNGTATAGNDYVAASGTVTFAFGDTAKTVNVKVVGDVIQEGDETFFVNLSNAHGFVVIADDQGTGTIIDDDSGILNVPADYATVQEAFNAAAEGDTILVAPGTYPGSVLLSGKSVVLASWFLTTGNSSYIDQTILDGDGGNTVITIEESAGSATGIIGLTIQNADDGISPHAKFDILNCRIINCSDGIDYESGSGGLCKLNVFENNSDDGIDLDRNVDIVIEDNIIRNNKDDGIEIRLQPYEGPLLNYIIRNNRIYDNGEDGIQLIDYDTLSDRIFVIERNLIYNNRMAGLGCMGGTISDENYEGASIPERIYLFNNTFVANDYGVTGGDSLVAVNNIFADHTGIASKNVDGGSIVSYDLYWNNGTDFENCKVDSPNVLFARPTLDSEFHLAPTSPAISAGTAFFVWQGDTVLNLPLSRYKGIAPDLGAFEYEGDATPSLSINDVTVTECNTAMVQATFTVGLSFAVAQTVTVDYSTADGTATAPGDYNALPLSTLSFSPGTTMQNITVLVNGDEIEEQDETFFVNLTNAVNATIADPQGVGTILDDDGAKAVTVSFQDGVDDYTGMRDTKLLAGSPDTNFGSEIELEVDGSPDESSLLYWDVSSIPTGSTIQSVNLTVNVTNISTAEYEFYEVRRPWVEGEATWNAYAFGQMWQVAGADGPEDRGSTVLGTITGPSKGLKTISLNSAGVAVVQSWVDDPSSNFGFIILDYNNATDGLDLSSRETTKVANRPKLTVTYFGPGHEQRVAQIMRGPYLQLGTPTSIDVRWRTDVASDSRIRYGNDPKDLSAFMGNSTITTEHELTLSGLVPHTKYYYSVGSSEDTTAIGPDYFFVTAPTAKTPKKSRIWVLGDAGTANSDQEAVRDAYYTFTDTVHTDLWVMLGDNAYSDGTDTDYQEAVFDMYPAMLRKSVLWPAFGNHDGHSASSPTQTGVFYDIFTLPANGEAGGTASGTEAYYSFEYANIHFICLNSHDMPRERDGEMLTWLQNDLAANSMSWTIAFWHHPPYSKGSHDSDSESRLIEMRSNALPILEEGGVDLVLCGHSHSYERSFLLDGHYGLSSTLADSMIIDDGDGRTDGNGAYHKVTFGPASHEGAVYVVAGSSGKTSSGSLDHPAMYVSLKTLGSVVLDVDSNRIDLTFLDDTGSKRDYFTLVKGTLDVSVPVGLSSFIASVTGRNVQLQWQTETETNNLGFEIERYMVSRWDSIGFVPGKGTSAVAQSYEFRDDLSNIGAEIVEVKYRLKQMDVDGSFAYSHALTVNLDLPKEAQLRQNYPNPFNPTTRISYFIPHPDFVSLKLYDTLGKEVQTLVHEFQKAGTHSVDFDARRLSSGIYFYRLSTNAGFVSTRKMLYLR